MEQSYWLYLDLPLELSLEVLSEAGDKAIASIASLNKSHLDLFKKPNGLFQRLVARICNKHMKDIYREDIDWYREFRIVSYYYDQILNNKVVDPRELQSLKAAYEINESVKLLPEETLGTKVLIQQSTMPLYPLPYGDYSTAYYEVEMDEYFGEEDVIAMVYVGASLHGSIYIPGYCRNSFTYASCGEIGIENTYSWKDETFQKFYIDLGDIVGFGINFKKQSIFFTLNGDLIYETNETVFGKSLLNLKALHAQVCIELIKNENDAEELRRVTPTVNFGDDEFAFNLVEYQQGHLVDQQNSSQTLRTYSNVIAEHVLSYPDYETIKAYEEDPERLNHLMVTPTDFPSNVKTKLDHFLYALYFLRSAYHDLPDGERMEEEFTKFRKKRSILALMYDCDRGKKYYSDNLIREFEFEDVIESEGREEFFQSRYKRFSWDICDVMLDLIKGHKWTLVWGAFLTQNEWGLAVVCYRVYTWQYLMKEDGKEMAPEHVDAARKLLSKILRIEEPQPTPEFIEFDIAFCQYCLSNLRWLAIKTLIQERNVFIRRQIIKKRLLLKNLFGATDPIIKKWHTTLKLLAPVETNEDPKYDSPLQRLALRFFDTTRNRANDERKMDVTKIDFGSEEELLKARVFDCIRREKIFGDFEVVDDDENVEPETEDHVEPEVDLSDLT